MLFALNIICFVSVRRLLQLMVCIGVSTPPHLKNMTSSFAKSPLESANYPSPSFLGKSLPSPQHFFFSFKNCNPPKKVTHFPSFFVFLFFVKKYFIYQLPFALMNNVFPKQNRFLLLSYCWLILILLFCVYVFLGVLFHISAIMK